MSSPPTPLAANTEARLAQIGTADLLVGIPSFNNATTIGRVVRAVQAGLAKHFPDHRAVLVNADGGSHDGTPQIAAEELADLNVLLIRDQPTLLHRIVTPYQGIPGKGSAFRTIFEIARRLCVKACAVVDADLRSITPEWIELLLQPIVQGEFDYVAPLYQRHKYDGTITNSIAYPLTRALYGVQVRQPIGGEFGFSGHLANHYLARRVWETDVARFGIDIWMTTEALASGARVCQSFLGSKLHNPKDPAADLSDMLSQVTGALFSLMHQHSEAWLPVTGSHPVPQFGFHFETAVEPIPINVDRMLAVFHQGMRDLDGIWTRMLEDDTRRQLQTVAERQPFHMPDLLWVRILYDIALAYHTGSLPKDHVLKAMTPLYLGKTASFILQTEGLTTSEAEQHIDALCQAFESDKSYLVSRWPSITAAAAR